jgi:hypothetical protein
VVARWEGVQVPVAMLGAGECGDRPGGGGRDAASLEGGQDVPACLVDRLVLPAAFPVADDAGGAPVRQDDGEHLPGSGLGEPQVALVPVQELGLGFRSAEVRHHFGCVDLPQEAEAGVCPCIQPDGRRSVVHAGDGSSRH